MDESIVEMSYSIERNIRMLHSQLSTQYGNQGCSEVFAMVERLAQARFA